MILLLIFQFCDEFIPKILIDFARKISDKNSGSFTALRLRHSPPSLLFILSVSLFLTNKHFGLSVYWYAQTPTQTVFYTSWYQTQTNTKTLSVYPAYVGTHTLPYSRMSFSLSFFLSLFLSLPLIHWGSELGASNRYRIWRQDWADMYQKFCISVLLKCQLNHSGPTGRIFNQFFFSDWKIVDRVLVIHLM